jgi:membrane protease YdiL (CAAX protease family)
MRDGIEHRGASVTGESKPARRRAVFVAVGYGPALVLVAGPLYLIARFGLERVLAASGLAFLSRRLAEGALMDLLVVPLVLAVTWAYLRLVKAGDLSGLGLSLRRGAPWALPGGAAIAAAGLTAVLGVDLALGGSVLRGTNPLSPWFLLAALASATRAGWVEEIVCRGVLLQQLERGINAAAAVSLSTIVFLMPHWSSSIGHGPIRWVGLLLLGLTFAAAIMSPAGACGSRSAFTGPSTCGSISCSANGRSTLACSSGSPSPPGSAAPPIALTGCWWPRSPRSGWLLPRGGLSAAAY